jgi:VWFA-related protein
VFLAPSTLKAQQKESAEEISTRDVEPTFKLRAERNLVMVRVVVRDGKGATVDNLRQEDFQLFDRGKKQTILHFSLEKPRLSAAQKPALGYAANPTAAGPEAIEESTLPSTLPQRFVALFFDDVNTKFEDLASAREAAKRLLPTLLQPGDRVGVFTSSGQKQLDFTADPAQVRQALLDIQARPLAIENTCGTIPPYEAYMIVEQNDPTATNVAIQELVSCNLMDSRASTTSQKSQVLMEAQRAESLAEASSLAALRGIETLVRRLAALPGQRSVVLISGGFLTETLRPQLDQISDRALRANVILNAVDARGLYASAALVDASQRGFATGRGDLLAQKGMLMQEEAQREGNSMGTLALNTGGFFFENSNDLEAGLRRAAALPEAYYLLAFSPQNLKLDGAFHALKVALVSRKGLAVQARKGYYAPAKPNDPAVQEKEEIQEAVFSQDQRRELPIDVHTEFFMKDQFDAHVAVLARLDLHQINFHKEAGLNVDHLTFVFVLFDRDGHLVAGQQKALALRLRDASLEKYLRSGITLQSEFKVTPGTYLARTVVRESESGEISSLNRTVEIPY